MSVNFRKGLFGFNCDDVIEYIEKSHKIHTEKETMFKEQSAQYESKISELTATLESIIAEKQVYEEELKKYLEKQAEIEKLCENIGRMYLVSEVNAKAIMTNAEKSREIAQTEIAANIGAIERVHALLTELQQGVTDASTDFAKKLSEAQEGLETAKADISVRESESTEKTETFNEFVKQTSVN